MAYVAGQDEEDDLQKAQQAATGLLAPMAAPAAAPGVAPATSPAPPAQNQSKFVNFDRYLKANQSGSEQLGNDIASKVGGQAESTKQQIDSASAQFERDAGVNPAGDLSRKIAGAPTLSEQGQRQPGTVRASGPAPGTKIEQTQPEYGAGLKGTPQRSLDGTITLADAQARAAKTYTGPESLQDAPYNYDGLVKSATEAQDNLGAISSPEGRAAYLRKNFGPTTTGGSALDTALLGSTSGQKLGGLAAKYGNLNDYLSNANSAAAAIGSQAKAQTNGEAARYGNLVKAFTEQQGKSVDTGQDDSAYRESIISSLDTAGSLLDKGGTGGVEELWSGGSTPDHPQAGYIPREELYDYVRRMSPADLQTFIAFNKEFTDGNTDTDEFRARRLAFVNYLRATYGSKYGKG